MAASPQLRRLAERIHRKRLIKAGPLPVDVDKVCHAKQAALVRAILGGVGRGATVGANCGRQSGKSHGGALATDLALVERPAVNWLYVTSTYESCRKMAFRPAVELNRVHGLGGDPVDMEMRMPNGSIGYFMGADNDRTIERLRGTPNLAGCIIDEAGLYAPEQLRQMIEAVKPGLRPLAGVLCVMGTPSRAGKQGTWYDLTVNPAVEQHKFDYRDNDRVPSFADVERLIDEELAMLFPHLTPAQRRQTAYFLREYLAEFVVDLAEKVYQLTDKNLADDIPTDLETFITGGDIGVSANDALVSLGWKDNQRGQGDVWVVDQEEQSGQDSIACADMVHEHNRLRAPLEIAMDPGGLGVKTILTVKRLYPSVPIVEAEKPPIGIQVRAVNYLLQGGENWCLKIKRGSKLALELATPTWVDGIVGGAIDEHGKHSDLVPCLRYVALKAKKFLPDVLPMQTPEEIERERYLASVARGERQARLARQHDKTYDPDEFMADLSDDLDQ